MKLAVIVILPLLPFLIAGQNVPINKLLIDTMLLNEDHGSVEILQSYFSEDFQFITNYSKDSGCMGNGTGFIQWLEKVVQCSKQAFEQKARNTMISIAEEELVSMMGYGLAKWNRGEFMWIQAPHKVVPFAISTFYQLKNNKIDKVWLTMDMVHLMYESSCMALPLNWNPLKQGLIMPPSAMDGLPAPVSFNVIPGHSEVAKTIVWQAMNHDLLLGPEAFMLWRNDMKWYGSYGFGLANDFVEYSYFFTRALGLAFTDRHLDIDVLICEGSYCGAQGRLLGNFSGNFLGNHEIYALYLLLKVSMV